MLVLLGLVPRYPGQSIEEFMRLWSAHAPWAQVVPKRVGYLQNFPVLRDGRHLLPYPGFDVCAETVYADEQAMVEAFATPQSDASFDDHRKFVSERGYCHVLADERLVRVDGAPASDAVKLMTFMRSHPAEEREALIEAATGPYASSIQRLKPLRHEQLVATKAIDREGVMPTALKDLRLNLTLSACDIVDTIWFATAEEAVRFVASEAAYEASLALAGTVLGTERLVARARVNTPAADLA